MKSFMNTISLNPDTEGFPWHHAGNVHVKGYLFDRAGNFYDSERLLQYFPEINSPAGFEEKLMYANGCFSVVYFDGESIFLATDPVRTFPLFYTSSGDNWKVSDDPSTFPAMSSPSTFNETACIEFLATGYVTGKDTILEGVQQVQAGEMVQLKPSGIRRKFYFTYRTARTLNEDYSILRTKGSEILKRVFTRLCQSLDGRLAVLPLSGGFDSRLIAVMMKVLGYSNVLCITYGRMDNREMRIAKKVAECLGFKWIGIEYTPEMIAGYLDTPEFDRYFRYASKYTSMFFMQEYFAVRFLRDNNLIPSDSIFIPGLSGDFLGGSQLSKHGNLLEEENISDIARRILFIKYGFVRPSGRDKEVMHERILQSLEEKYHGERALAYTLQEDWDMKEKLAKFNANCVTTYTFFGYEFRLPYWDKDLVEFFRDLPLHMKINKYLYDDILTSDYFEPFGLNFPEELQASEKVVKRQRIRNRLKRFLPQGFIRLFRNRYDTIFYNEITRHMVEDMLARGIKIKIFNNTYNSIIVQWYMAKVREKASGMN